MTILSDRDIRRLQDLRGDLITPFADANVQPASIDLTLGGEFIRAGEEWFSDEWTMLPGEFLLATTVESVSIPPSIVAQVNGKSSWARKGLIVHTTAGFIDPGFSGQITLELKNVGHEPIMLKHGVRICQLVFSTMTSAAEFPYGHERLGSHYQGQSGVTGSAL